MSTLNCRIGFHRRRRSARRPGSPRLGHSHRPVCEVRDHPAVEPAVACHTGRSRTPKSNSSHARPTATILPSDWIATSAALSLFIAENRRRDRAVAIECRVERSGRRVSRHREPTVPGPGDDDLAVALEGDGRGRVGGRPEVGHDDAVAVERGVEDPAAGVPDHAEIAVYIAHGDGLSVGLDRDVREIVEPSPMSVVA